MPARCCLVSVIKSETCESGKGGRSLGPFFRGRSLGLQLIEKNIELVLSSKDRILYKGLIILGMDLPILD